MRSAELGELEAFRDLCACAPADLGAQAREIAAALCFRLEAAPPKRSYAGYGAPERT